jgi:hypothetical protein
VTQIQAWTKDRLDHGMPLEMICSEPSIVGNNEQVIFCLPNIQLMEPRAVRYSQRQSQGSYGGSSIRIMKGFSIRTGGYGGRSQSQSESVDELRFIDHGTLVLTTKRLVFLGAKRTSNVKLQDIISVESTYQDGFELHREHKDKVEIYVFSEPLQIREGSGQYLGVFPPMVCTSIRLAKNDDEVGPEGVAAYREYCENKLKLKAVQVELKTAEMDLQGLQAVEATLQTTEASNVVPIR